MKDERLRVPVDASYLEALGMAVFCFSRLEWSAVWCCQKLQPGYVEIARGKTAGAIAKDFLELSSKYSDQFSALDLASLAAEFQHLVEDRNALVHANPGTAPDGAQRLFRDGSEWTIEMLADQADRFACTDTRLNAFVHQKP